MWISRPILTLGFSSILMVMPFWVCTGIPTMPVSAVITGMSPGMYDVSGTRMAFPS
ncbi:hypothetical protein D3C87_2155260 [compost metagenome]